MKRRLGDIVANEFKGALSHYDRLGLMRMNRAEGAIETFP
jgi:hypothetical protein